MSVIEKITHPSASGCGSSPQRQPKEEVRVGLNLCDNLFTEQNCAHANRFVSVQVLAKKIHETDYLIPSISPWLLVTQYIPLIPIT